MTYDLDVIVPQYNQSAHTVRFIQSFRRHAGRRARLILVDNGSEQREYENAVAVAGNNNCLLIRNSENLGFVRAVNQGLCASDAPYVVIQNNDTEIYKDCYGRLMRILESDSQIGAVGPLTSPCDSWQSIDHVMSRWGWLKQAIDQKIGKLPTNDHAKCARNLARTFGDQSHQIYGMIAFFCAMFPRKVIDAVGLLSTDYGIGLGDDDDFCARIRQHGFKLMISPGTYVFHNHRTTFKSIFTDEDLRREQEKNIKIFRDKWNTLPKSGA